MMGIRRIARTVAVAALAIAIVLKEVAAQQAGIPIGGPAPNATVETLDGKPIELAQFINGKPVVLEFWATWCPLCKQLEPTIKAVKQKYAGRVTFVMIGVTDHQTQEKQRKFAQERQIGGELVYDAHDRAVAAYKVPNPSYVAVINGAGTLVYTGVGGEQPINAAIGKALPAQFPAAAVGETRGLEFHVSTPLHETGVDAQTRAAFEELLQKNHGARIVKLRVFAVGEERLKAIEHQLGDLLVAHHAPLPVLSLVGAAGFPTDDQLVQIESIAEGQPVANRQGIAFLAGLAAPSGDRTMSGLAKVAHEAGVANENVLRVSCFYESRDQVDATKSAVAATFPSAEASFVLSYTGATSPAVECEAVASMTVPTTNGTQYINLPGTPASPNFSRAALVSTPRVAFTGGELALGETEADVRAPLERTSAALERVGAHIADVAMADNYWLTAGARDELRTVRPSYYGQTVPAATGVFFTGLAAAPATVAMELAVPVRQP